MEPTYDGRGPEAAAAEKTAVPGGNSTEEPAKNGTVQSGAPRSWRQYIEQTLPAKDANQAADPRDAGVLQSAPIMKKRAGSAWERFKRRTTRWRRENGKKAQSFAAAAAVCGKKLSAAAIREKLSGAAAACQERLGPGAARIRDAVARHPVSPLLYVTLLAMFIGVAAFQGNYARAYVLEVNDQKLGLVSGADEVNTLLSNVELRAASLLGDDFDYEVDVTLSPVYAAPGDLTDAAEMEDALLEVVGAYATANFGGALGTAADAEKPTSLTAWALSVDGEVLGYAASKEELYRMLDEIAQPWLPENCVRYEFVEDVQVYPVEQPLSFRFGSLDPIREELSSMRVEEAVYVVKKGDTFNAIAYSLDMDPNDLSALNPDVKVNLIWVDQELIIQQAVPRLSVMAITDETYEEVISSPVEYIETADLYVGDTRIKTKGEDGLALVNAQVTYINNREMAREVVESTTLVEATTTYVYSGTTPRPATASKGYFIWPVNGTISSNFGSRYIFGRTSFHYGLDIYVPTGTTVKAADGGTVTFAGWNNGGYGYLVVIRHDNGMLTYYAHNSSVLVSVGQKVYQGQAIAKSGATGQVTGPHCHFEIRINGTCVNPRNYLP